MLRVFFRRKHVDEDFQLVTSEATKQLCFSYFGLEQYRKSQARRPLIFGSVTDWAAIRLISAFDHAVLHLGVAAEAQAQGKERVFKQVDQVRSLVVGRLNGSE